MLEYQISENIQEQLIKNPYNTIREYAEIRLTKVGRKLFSYLSLQPVSLVAPDIPVDEEKTRANMHFLILGPPSSGKTSSLRLVRDTVPNPYIFQDVTAAKLAMDLYGRENISLLCTDVDTIFRDMELVKLIESAIGEEHSILRFNMRTTSNFDVNATFSGCGVFESLRDNIRHGFLQRTIPIVIFHSKEEKALIGQSIKDGMFSNRQKISFMDIKWYYDQIFQIQRGHNEDFPKIDGYHVDKKVMDELYRVWLELLDKNNFPDDQYLTREFNSIIKYMCVSAMLNIFTREIVNSNSQRLIVPNRADIELAKSLFNNEIKVKYNIMTLNHMAGNIKREHAIKFYEYVRDNPDIAQEYKQIGKIFAEQKIDKRIKEN